MEKGWAHGPAFPQSHRCLTQTLVLRPKNNEMTNNTRNTANRIFAIPAAAPAMPVKPSNAAISAITKSVTVQLNILFPPCARRWAAGVSMFTGRT